MAKPELGTKRICTECSAKFYDLMKDPAVCPKCGTELNFQQEEPKPEPEKEKVVAPEAKSKADTDDNDKDAPESDAVVSFEEADKETKGAKSARIASLDDDDDDDDDDLDLGDDVVIDDLDDDDVVDDSTLLDDDDDFDDDVSNIIDADISKEE